MQLRNSRLNSLKLSSKEIAPLLICVSQLFDQNDESPANVLVLIYYYPMCPIRIGMPTRHCPFSSEHCLSLSITEFYFLQHLKKVVVILVMTSGLVVAAGISEVDAGLPWYCIGQSISATALDTLVAIEGDMNTSYELVDLHFTQAVCNIRYVGEHKHACAHLNTFWIIFLLAGS